MIFLHGGSWRSGRSADIAVYAEPFVKAGVDRLPKIAQPATTAANTNGRSRHDHSFTRQMFREWLRAGRLRVNAVTAVVFATAFSAAISSSVAELSSSSNCNSI